MNMVPYTGAFSIVVFCLSSFMVARAFKPVSISEFTLVSFTTLTSLIIAAGYLLSSLDAINKITYWCATGLIIMVPCFLLLRFQSLEGWIRLRVLTLQTLTRMKEWFIGLSLLEKVLLFPPTATIVLLGLVNLVLVVFVAPHNWDSMAYHLTRMAYYIQHGNLDYFDANYWAHVVHPKNSTILFLYTYLVFGWNENLTQLVQFASYWVSIIAVYAIARRAGSNVTASVFAATAFGLLIECLMEAITPQNDFIWTSCFAVTVYAFVSYRQEQHWKYLVLAVTGIALSLGVKASSVLAIPSFAVITLYSLYPRKQLTDVLGDWAVLIVAGVVALAFFALPSGYYDNYVRFGNPVGPQHVVDDHSFAHTEYGTVLREGSKNVLRYATDFISLDGLPPTGITNEAQKLARALPIQLVELMGVNQDSNPYPAGFSFDKAPIAHEDLSSGGVLGFGLIWIAVLVALFHKATPPTLRVLSIAAIVYLVSQSFAGPYQEWRGRYFLFGSVLGAPTIAGMMRWWPAKMWRVYAAGIMLLGCVCALSAVVLRPVQDERGFFRPQNVLTLLGRDRLDQLTTNLGKFRQPLRQFEERVPSTAIVAVCLTKSGFEYPLFGEKLTRTLLPINSFVKGVQPIPKTADVLLFSAELMAPLQEDVFLGESWYLRFLRKP